MEVSRTQNLARSVSTLLLALTTGEFSSTTHSMPFLHWKKNKKKPKTSQQICFAHFTTMNTMSVTSYMLIMFTAVNLAEYVWANPKSDKEPSSLSKF